MNNTNLQNSEEINIIDLISQLDILGKEKNKDDFIKNYLVLKEQIEKTDKILENNTDSSRYNSYSIQELFGILESNSELLSNPDILDVSKLKMLLDVSKNLENKLEIETINIIESK